jgi:hypothetical protein
VESGSFPLTPLTPYTDCGARIILSRAGRDHSLRAGPRPAPQVRRAPVARERGGPELRGRHRARERGPPRLAVAGGGGRARLPRMLYGQGRRPRGGRAGGRVQAGAPGAPPPPLPPRDQPASFLPSGGGRAALPKPTPRPGGRSLALIMLACGSTGSFRPRAAVAAGLVPESGTKIVKHESDCKKPACFYRSRFEHPVAPVKGGA